MSNITQNIQADWIAVDWGTSNLRLWAMSASGEKLAAKESDKGMGQLSSADYEPLLLSLVEEWLHHPKTSVIACGMVGSRQGWQEAPYQATPCSPTTDFQQVAVKDSRLDVHILAGVKQENPADVMRGEETQLAGFLAQNPDFQGCICLPGTHSKWVKIDAGEIKEFHTAMTGEIFALLQEKSILRHSMGGWDDAAFLNAVKQSFDHPEKIMGNLFSVRAASLLQDSDAGKATLSGTLIGQELAAMAAMFGTNDIALIGANKLSELYQSALAEIGIKAHIHAAETITLDGLTQAYRKLTS